jgi:hypothetical protein
MLRAVPDSFAPMLASALIAADASRQAGAGATPTTASEAGGADAPARPATATTGVPATAPVMGVAA